jgi:hypothetical protein
MAMGAVAVMLDTQPPPPGAVTLPGAQATHAVAPGGAKEFAGHGRQNGLPAAAEKVPGAQSAQTGPVCE